MKFLKLLLILLLISHSSFSQSKKTRLKTNYELGIFTGVSNYQGDLTKRDVSLNQTNLAFGLIGRYNLTPHFSLRTTIYYGKLSGDDADTDWKIIRNANFSTHLIEIGAGGELNIIKFVPRTNHYRFTTYLLFGVSGYSYGKNFSKFDVAIPYGVGFKIGLTPYWNLGLEVGQRLLFTDYLDGVRNTYGVSYYDKYLFSGLTISRNFYKTKVSKFERMYY